MKYKKRKKEKNVKWSFIKIKLPLIKTQLREYTQYTEWENIFAKNN